MIGIQVKKVEDQLIIRWQLSKTIIPIADITEIYLDDTYAGTDPAAVRIGLPSGTSERIVIRTHKQSYVLFLFDSTKMMNRLQDDVGLKVKASR
ncbi:hypothetical protein Q5741_01370 [Paenibacillus sp. JX-17]|uniref:Sublancin immunity protein SunI-like PH domain-containing protein n=1 Tax=Paenibacillus lacisoli TaxID=3064525 RepID=A0ABT9C716_9BACL|nr:hypothetical protein [Paenibacillus sp. JX-17]MDO7905060.1 hypothetical protein [Paenibacillus sp. JX-17]